MEGKSMSLRWNSDKVFRNCGAGRTLLTPSLCSPSLWRLSVGTLGSARPLSLIHMQNNRVTTGRSGTPWGYRGVPIVFAKFGDAEALRSLVQTDALASLRAFRP